MNETYKNKRRRIFDDWRYKVKKQLPKIVIKFYSLNTHIDYEHHVKLGRVISFINNPYYGIQDDRMNNLDYIGQMTSQITLKILVEELFELVNKKSTQENVLTD